MIQVYDFDRDDVQDIYYMVMEFIDGPSLKTRLESLAEQSHTMPLPEAVGVAVDIAHALEYAHQRRMIHRDIKPTSFSIRTSN